MAAPVTEERLQVILSQYGLDLTRDLRAERDAAITQHGLGLVNEMRAESSTAIQELRVESIAGLNTHIEALKEAMRADIGSIQVQLDQGVTAVLQDKINEANQVVNNITTTIARGAEMQAAIIEEVRVQRGRIDQVITRANDSSAKAELERQSLATELQNWAQQQQSSVEHLQNSAQVLHGQLDQKFAELEARLNLTFNNHERAYNVVMERITETE